MKHRLLHRTVESRFAPSIAVCLLALLGCSDDRRAAKSAGPDAMDAGSSDGSLLSDTGLDASLASPRAICDVEVRMARYISELTCAVPLAQPGTAGPIYRSIQEQGGGIVASFELCDANPLAWYPDDPATPTNLIACGPACLRTTSLFPVFVAAIKPFAGCDEPASPSFLCSLSEEQYAQLSGIACVIPIADSREAEAIDESLQRQGARVASTYADCADNPLAWYPDDPAHPTKLIACGAACALSIHLFPALFAATKSFLGCDAPEAPAQRSR